MMKDFLEILKYTIPSIVVLAIAYYLLKTFVESNTKFIGLFSQELKTIKENQNQKENQNPDFVRLQLQAYERLTLFLERINPTNLVPRLMLPTQNVSQLHSALLHALREEYEHNMSQQIYLTDLSWELIKAAKESVVNLVNQSDRSLKGDDKAVILAAKILTSNFEKGKDPVENALSSLKKDIREQF